MNSLKQSGRTANPTGVSLSWLSMDPMDMLGEPVVEEIAQALEDVFASPAFVKSRRSRELLKYLLEKACAGEHRDLSEYAVGIEFFERDPRSYSTGEDPIVRVQIGRLRERLKQHYASRRNKSPIRFSIPLGSYVPKIDYDASNTQAPPTTPELSSLRLIPFTCIAAESACTLFTQGLNEELSDQLFKQLGRSVKVHHLTQPELPFSSIDEAYCLEGSVRYEVETLKVAIRLVQASSADVVWSQQFKQQAPCLNLSLQESLATELCQVLRTYFCHSQL